MEKKNCVIITPFYNYSFEVRVKYLEMYFGELGFKVYIITSNFDHRTKAFYRICKNNVIQIDTKAYKKNLSIARIKSHIDFSKKAVNYAEQLKPDVVYVSGPPNTLYKRASKLKKSTACKLLFEVGDLWPETFPVGKALKMMLSIPFFFWKHKRDAFLKAADIVFFECSMFEKKLKTKCLKSTTLYLSKENIHNFKNSSVEKHDFSKGLNVLYLGSLNHLIDYDFILTFMTEMVKAKNAKLVIIGDGESRRDFLNSLRKAGIPFEFHGIVYDETKKREIISSCQLGLNIMKSAVEVGVTMKSMEYFYYGLVVVNNIKDDSWQIVNNYKCGFNVSSSADVGRIVNAFVYGSNDELLDMRNNSLRVYFDLFDEKNVKEKIKVALWELGLYEKENFGV